MRILVLESENEVANDIIRGLVAARYAVDRAATAAEGLEWAKEDRYDAAVIDMNLGGGMSGLGVCVAMRERGASFPIIMLSASNDPAVRIRALDNGADDYLVKPFVVAELRARVRALLRRGKALTAVTLVVGDLVMDTLTHKVSRAGKPITLGRKEYVLLEYLMRNAGVPLKRATLLEHVWDMNADPFTNTVDVHISFLRAKIDSGRRKKMIRTVYGFGYKIEG